MIKYNGSTVPTGRDMTYDPSEVGRGGSASFDDITPSGNLVVFLDLDTGQLSAPASAIFEAYPNVCVAMTRTIGGTTGDCRYPLLSATHNLDTGMYMFEASVNNDPAIFVALSGDVPPAIPEEDLGGGSGGGTGSDIS